MKKLILLLAFCLPALLVSAQSKEEAAVAAAVEELRQALLSGKREALAAITLPQLSYGHSSGVIENQAAFIEALASGKSDFLSIELSDQEIILSGKTALVRHTLSGEAVNNGQTGPLKLGVLLVWQKTGGRWKLLGRQAFRKP